MVLNGLFVANGLGFFGFLFPAFRSNLSLRGTKTHERSELSGS